MSDIPRTFFITRHDGARIWAARHGHSGAAIVEHLGQEMLASLRPGDRVLGSLPVHLAAEVSARRARYFHLTLDLPPEARGLNLSADDMEGYGARLEEFVVMRA